MGHQIIKQPNGNFSIFSTVTDAIIGYQISRKELIDYYKKEAAKKEEKRVSEILDKIERGEKPYFQFTKKWEDVKNTIPPEWISSDDNS